MDMKEIMTNSGGAILVLLTLIQIAPIKINPWSWLADSLGKLVNSSLSKSIDNLNAKLDKINGSLEKTDNQILKINSRVESIEDNMRDTSLRVKNLEHEVVEGNRKCDERNIVQCRSRMLRFGDEILHGKKHSKDHFDQILLDCTDYENYCREHPEFLNNITAQTNHLIKITYEQCMRDNSFL